MAGRRPRSFDLPPDRDEILATVRVCRKAMIGVTCKVTINGPVYRAADAVMAAIDDMAGALTGDREYFWIKPAPSKIDRPHEP